MFETIESIHNSREFQRTVLQSDRPVLAIFYTDWCEDSYKLQSVLSELLKDYGDRVRVVKADTDKAPDLEQLYQIKVTPTVLLFEHGEITRRWNNDLELGDYRQVLEGVMAQRH